MFFIITLQRLKLHQNLLQMGLPLIFLHISRKSNFMPWTRFLFSYLRNNCSIDIHILTICLYHQWRHRTNPYLGSTVLISFSNWSAARDCKTKNITVRIHKTMIAILIFRTLKYPRTIWQIHKKEHILGTMMTKRNIISKDILSFLVDTLQKIQKEKQVILVVIILHIQEY